jgi:fatty acid synthase subunit alpha
VLINTTGADLRSASTTITRSLCEQVLTTPIHWAKAVNFPETTTHAVDFGPGGISGIGPLTARLLEGRGVRVVVVGDKSKGSAELYDHNVLKYEQAWAKKFAPRLVKTRLVDIHLTRRNCLLSDLAAMALSISTLRSLVSLASLPSWWPA